MELRQILYFVAIAEVEHFERLPRGVRLTAAGRVLLGELQGVQAQLARAVAAVPAESPLAARSEVALADLAGQPLIGFQRRGSPRFFDDLHSRFRAAGFWGPR